MAELRHAPLAQAAAGLVQGLAQVEQRRRARAARQRGTGLAEAGEHRRARPRQVVLDAAEVDHRAEAVYQPPAVGRAGRRHGAGQALDAVDRDQGRARIDRVGHVQRGREHRARRRVVDRGDLGADLHQAEIGMGVEQPGRDDAPLRLEHRGAFRHGETAPDLGDTPSAQQHVGRFQHAGLAHRVHGGAADQHGVEGRGRRCCDRGGEQGEAGEMGLHRGLHGSTSSAVPRLKSVGARRLASPRT
jgi:hypothetical protein